ncbi:hypothetical protein GCM10010350_63930 [Streptomyces galilaeus]|nr:hypothetical protein GCM10010350_63930 [Streptomyces galilaeus]
MRANRVLSVLAGGSLRCAFDAASTSPVPASATSHDSAETAGTPGAPGRGRTCVPERYSRAGRGALACGPSAGPGSAATGAAGAAGPRARTPTAQSTQADAAAREENPIVI